MSKARKDAKNISVNMNAEIVDRLHEYAEEKGQTLTMAAERLLKEWLDKYEKQIESKHLDTDFNSPHRA